MIQVDMKVDQLQIGLDIRVKLQTSLSAGSFPNPIFRRIGFGIMWKWFRKNNEMRKLIYINYFIYKFYERKDPDPVIYSFFGSSLLVSLNIMSGLIVLQEFLGFQSLKYYSVFVLGVFLCVNYFYLYRKLRYKEIFFKIGQEDNLNRKFLYFIIYLLGTFILILSLVIFIRMRKFDSL